MKNFTIEDLVANLQIEEEQARTRGLIRGLQPLYYAAEALDEQLSTGADAEKHRDWIVELSGVLRNFLGAHEQRDAGEHIRRRLDSINKKLSRSGQVDGSDSSA